MTWRGRALAALLLSALAGFVRSTTVPDRPDEGKPLFWKDGRVTYRVNATGFGSVPGCASATAAAELARRSLLTWSEATRAGESQPCTSFRFVDGGDTTQADLGYDSSPGASNVNLIAFREGLCAAITTDPDCQGGNLGACVAHHDCWMHDSTIGPGGTLALTTLTYRPDTGEILDADLELNGWNGDVTSPTGWYLTCNLPPAPICDSPPYGRPGCIEIDVGNTVTHEAGHMLGLDHVCVPSYPPPFDACPTVTLPDGGTAEPVMAPTALAGDTDKRQLKPDDVAGVCTIYPVGGGCGCRTGGGGGALALLALGFALWRRRRAHRTTAPA